MSTLAGRRSVVLYQVSQGRSCIDSKRTYERDGEDRLANAKPIPKTSPNQTSIEVEEKVLHLRRKYHLGPERIMWYMARYHSVRMSDATIYRILRRHGINRLPRGKRVRKIHTKRYNKQVPGHHIQMDVKFLTFIGKNGGKVRRFQYTAIDDATRDRAFKVSIPRPTPSTSSITSSKSSRSVSGKSVPTTGMNSRPGPLAVDDE